MEIQPLCKNCTQKYPHAVPFGPVKHGVCADCEQEEAVRKVEMEDHQDSNDQTTSDKLLTLLPKIFISPRSWRSLLGVGLLLLGLAFGFLDGQLYKDLTAQTTARVENRFIRHKSSAGRYGLSQKTEQYITFSYKVESQTLTQTQDVLGPEYDKLEVGNTIPIYYNPRNPQQSSMRNSNFYPILARDLLLIVGVVVILIDGLLPKRRGFWS